MSIRQLKGVSKGVTPAVNLTKRDPKLAAAVSKMTSSPYGASKDSEGNRRSVTAANTYAFRAVLQKRAKRNSDAAQIMRLLPDIELSAQILTSSILSPKDMTTMELIYLGPKGLLTPALNAAMINRVKEHFENEYPIKSILTEMVREPLFEKGAYPIAVIPENAIDEFINSDRPITMEALADFVDKEGQVRNIGILGPRTAEEGRKGLKGIATESYYRNRTKEQTASVDNRLVYQDPNWQEYANGVACESLVVVDNPAVLKFPKLNAKNREKAVKAQYANGGNLRVAAEKMDFTVAEEAHVQGGLVNDTRVESAIYRSRQFVAEPIAVMKQSHELKRKSVGNPLIMKLPSEAVLPVHVPGDLKRHIGYFIILDEEGNPVEVPDGEESYNGLGATPSASAANSLGSNLIRKVETNMGGTGGSFDPMQKTHMEYAARVYADMVERDLIARVKNGVYGSNVALAKNEDVYRIMLSRVLAKKFTQVLYLPIEFMTYIAFKYGDDGVGRSLLDDTAMINTLRSVMLFSDVMAGVKNSIGRTKVTATIPDNDPNPMRTLERAQDEIVRSRMLGMPMGVSNLTDIFDFIQRAGYEWEIGGHQGLPDLKFEFMQTNSNYAKSDTDLQDLLRKSSIMAYGLSPETVDNGFNTEFAATALANNVLLAKRVMLAQDVFVPQLSDHLRKVLANTEDIVEDLKNILREKKKDIKLELEEGSAKDLTEEIKDKIIINRALQEFIRGFQVELPRPASITLENQMSDLETYSSALDKAIDAYISGDFFTSATAGEISNETNTIKATIKAYYIRKWLSDKGIMPELGDLVGTDDEGKPLLNIQGEMTEHVKALIRGGILALADLRPMVMAANQDMAKLNVEPSDTSSSSSSDSGGSSDPFGGDGFDFGGGGDPFGSDAGFGDDTLDAGTGDDVEIPSDADAAANEQNAASPADDNQESQPPV